VVPACAMMHVQRLQPILQVEGSYHLDELWRLEWTALR
jgi:hypothetical protein